MKHIFLFLIFFCNSLYAHYSAITEGEPSSLIEGIASVITGDLYLSEEDILIEGAEPLRLKRNYVGTGKSHSIFPHMFAEFFVPGGMITVTEPNGTALTYFHRPILEEMEHHHHKKKHKEHHRKKKRKEHKNHSKHDKQPYIFDPIDFSRFPGISNTARGALSARNNIKNIHLDLDKDNEHLTVYCSDGTKRRYRALQHQKRSTIRSGPYKQKVQLQYFYFLESEELGSGNKIVYDWNEENALLSVRTTNPSGTKTYARASFEYFRKKDSSPPDFNVWTSDGRRLEYRYQPFGQQNAFILERISSSQYPDETLHYVEKMGHPFLTEVCLPQGRRFSIVRDEAHRIKELKAPVGSNEDLVTTYTFTYYPEEKRTDVTDSMGAVIRYFWSDELRLIRIERYTKNHTLYNAERLGWGRNGSPDAGNLLFRTLYDQDGKPLSSKSYRYDAKGNVEEELFWGNLSGNGTLQAAPDGTPIQGENTKKRFAYNERNLVIREEEDNGKIISYEYLPGTHLCTTQCIQDSTGIKRRHFTIYYEDLIPIREIEDDGSATDPNNLTSVSTRLIKDYTHFGEGPYINMPRKIEEKYWDGGREVLLKTTLLQYTTGASISRQEIYDAQGAFSYALNTQYDPKGRPIEESNALGQIAKSGYDEIGNKIFFKDFSGNTTLHMSYDYSNRLTRSEEKANGLVRVTQHTFDTCHNRTSRTDFRENTTTYIYDDFNHVIETHSPPVLNEEGVGITPILHAGYDSAGRQVLSTNAKGNTTHTHYNAYGKPIEIVHPDGTKECFIYNLDGTLKRYIDQIGGETAYTYDIFGRETSKTMTFNNEVLSQEKCVYNAFNLTQKTDAEGHTTHYRYDGAGRKITEELEDRCILYGYDSLGRCNRTQYGSLVQIKEYDLLNRVISEKKQDGNGTILFQEEYRYDAAGNQTAIVYFPNNRKAEEFLTYDPFNRLIEKKDPLGHITTTTYHDQHTNAQEQKVLQKTTTDPLGNSTIETCDAKERIVCSQKKNSRDELLAQEDYFYDANDNLSQQVSTVLSASPKRLVTTRWTYDAMDRVISLKEGCGETEERTTAYIYTPKGFLEEKKKPDGTIISHSYNPMGRCIAIHSSDVHYTFQYNRIGQLLRSKDEIHQTCTEKEWNVHGQLLQETLANGLKLKSHYDAQGRRIALYLPDDTHIAYTYDPLYLRSVARHSEKPYVHTFTQYDLAGNLLEEQHIDQSSSQYSIDLLGRKYHFTHPHYSQQVLDYDPVGNILAMRFPEETVCYTYDDLYQLASETGLFAHDYSYDSHFNRLRKDEEVYSVNALNQMPLFTYDANGNPLSDGTKRFSYDALDRLICIEGGMTRYAFTYDAEHRRLSKQIHHRGEKIEHLHFLYDGQNEIGSIDANGAWKDLRILGRTESAEIGASVAMELQGQICMPLHDLQGNVCFVMPLGGTGENYRYSAFGEESAPHARCPWRFSSKRTDETHLVYYGRRYYSPSHGRWLTPDPQGLSAGINLYAFVSNDPLIKVDLYGLIESRWDVFKKFFEPENMKQSVIGAVHGAKDAGIDMSNDLFANTGYLVTSPLRAPSWATNKSAFSQDLRAFQDSKDAFWNASDRWMHRALPADVNNDYYQFFRPFSRNTLTMLTGLKAGVEIIKMGSPLLSYGYRSIKNAFSSKQIQQSLKVYSRELKESEKIASYSTKSRGKISNEDWAQLSGTLRQASKGKGNFGIGTASAEQANVMGEAWVGLEYRISSDGKAWISKNGMRQYRPPHT
jgi:RHS repeat-associated protein